jgi:lysophospholipase L1-like esterase
MLSNDFSNIPLLNFNNIMESNILNRKILALGDSLTKGYYFNGTKYHPFSLKMNELFHNSNIDCEVIPSGVNGETSESMKNRIKEFDLNIYELVIVFSGTNDLAYSISAEIIVQNILDIHDYINQIGKKSIHVSLLENKCDKLYNFYSEKRRNVNSLMKTKLKENKNVSICDLDSLFVYSKLSKEELKLYWDDALHLSPKGYDYLGEIFYKMIIDEKLIY